MVFIHHIKFVINVSIRYIIVLFKIIIKAFIRLIRIVITFFVIFSGLSLGVLNMAIVIPQMIVSFGVGPIDALFGGGNLPGFVVGAIAALISSVVALTVLP